MTVRVEGVDGSPFEGVKVYAFDGATYKGYSGTSGKDGQVTFTLPQGNYRFRGDLNGTQFWSGVENHCTMPGCSSASIVLPGGNTSRSAVTINYSYDGLSRLTAADYSNGDYYHYAYDSVGNLLTETTTKGETAYTYDPANRLTSVNGQAVQWDDNGNMLADGQAMYKYNTANKLVGVTKGASSIVYAYSGLGDRLKQIADGVTTDYTLDINAGLTQVLQDGKQTYLYGNARISQIAETQTGYFLPDALGSIRQMTDSSADLTLARAYDPYGNVVSSSGAGETVYGYTGEIQSGGLVHLRARDYASQLGRFTSRDTWEGEIKRPTSLNKWNYVEGNPISRIDPYGYCITNPNLFSNDWSRILEPDENGNIFGMCRNYKNNLSNTPNTNNGKPSSTCTFVPTSIPTKIPTNTPTPLPSPTANSYLFGDFRITHYTFTNENNDEFKICDNCYEGNVPVSDFPGGPIKYQRHNLAFVYGLVDPSLGTDENGNPKYNWGVYQLGTGITKDNKYLTQDTNQTTPEGRAVFSYVKGGACGIGVEKDRTVATSEANINSGRITCGDTFYIEGYGDQIFTVTDTGSDVGDKQFDIFVGPMTKNEFNQKYNDNLVTHKVYKILK